MLRITVRESLNMKSDRNGTVYEMRVAIAAPEMPY
jgi:hypothetical protein